MQRLKKNLRIIGGALLMLGWGATSSAKGPSRVRDHIEWSLNTHLDAMRRRADQDALTVADRILLHAGILGGALLSPLSPEGYAVLFHAAYGHGQDLQLSSRYFSRSPVIAAQVKHLGEGHHGPLWVKQSDDWRLSLCFNPYYLTITEDTVRISHPTMRFQKPGERLSITLVPVGRIPLRIPDNPVGPLQEEIFLAYAEWPR